MEHLEQVWQAREITTIDPEEFYDFQVSRPTITMAEGETRKIEWPTTRFSVASPPGTDRDVVLIRGIEPSMRWRTFCEQILEVCHSLEVNRIVLLGALLADVPVHPAAADQRHARRRQEVAEKYKVVPTRYDGPTGIVGVLQEAAGRADVDALSFWVHVPHYANNPPCPKATLALLQPPRGRPRPAGAAGRPGRGGRRVGEAGPGRRRAGRRARRVRPRAGGTGRRRGHHSR